MRRGRFFIPGVRPGGAKALQQIIIAVVAVLVIGAVQTIFLVYL